ncbi:hypothetical protein BU17DRAFT_36953 [Hysterangium stoloniferum]|nr:hypothetical protein BU17DRAFT_36953 [Hysterangium stoloniferum]
MKASQLILSALCTPLFSTVSALNLYHRIWSPSHPAQPFTLRGTIHYSLELGTPSFSSPHELALESDQSPHSVYQIALEREGDLSEKDWDVSSVKACHLQIFKSDHITLHVSSTGQLFALDYFLRPIPHDGSCPKDSFTSQKTITFDNTTLTLRTADIPPSPEFRAPPPLSATGEPIQVQPEKSFLQKYWMYIAIALLGLSKPSLITIPVTCTNSSFSVKWRRARRGAESRATSISGFGEIEACA